MNTQGANASLPLDSLHIWGKNPRKKPTEGELLQLAESIRRHGVLVPVTVRPKGAKWEVIDGQRRTLAARKEQLKEIPARVVEVSDAEAIEIGLVTALESQALSVLEQSDAFHRWMEETGEKPARLASRLSRSIEWIERRLSLQSLCPEMRAILTKRPELEGHMFIASRLTEEDQVAIEPELSRSIKAFRSRAEDFERLMETAPWNLADEDLPGGACSACPHRTASNPRLPGMGASGDDRCMSGECWGSNWKRYIADLLEELKLEHGEDVVTTLGGGARFPGFSEEPTGAYGLWVETSARGAHGWLKRPREIAHHETEVEEALRGMWAFIGTPIRGHVGSVIATSLWPLATSEVQMRLRRLFTEVAIDLDDRVTVPDGLFPRWLLTFALSMNYPLWAEDGPSEFLQWAKEAICDRD